MLTSSQSIVSYDFRQGTVHPDRLTRSTHRHYLRAADAMLSVYRRGRGHTRQALHHRVNAILDRLGDCPPRRAAAFCKLLDDRSEYLTAHGKAAALRRRLFTAAAPLHPIVVEPITLLEHSIEDARQKLAEGLGRPWNEIESELFADVIELQTLASFEDSDPFTATNLLAAYNVGQTQAALYRATRMTIWASEDLKTIVRHAKLAGLMQRITRLDGPDNTQHDAGPVATYRFELDGPASTLRQTWRYGIRFAKILPILLACRGWRLSADVLGPGPNGRRDRPYRLQLSPRDGLHSPHPRPDDFDSELEREIFAAWNRDSPSGWSLSRESELLHLGQTVLTPDFVLRRVDRPGDPIHVELIGFWTPEYLAEKALRLEQFRDHHWILIAPPSGQHAVPQGLAMLELRGKLEPQKLVELAAHVLRGSGPPSLS